MLSELARNWWIPLIRGLAAIAFGIMAFAWPGITLFALVLLFGVYAIIDGLAAIWFAIIERNQAMNWWGMLLVGLLSVAAGIVAIFWPGITAMALLMVIAAWAIVRGIFEIVAAIQLRKHIENEWALGLGGALSILFGNHADRVAGRGSDRADLGDRRVRAGIWRVQLDARLADARAASSFEGDIARERLAAG